MEQWYILYDIPYQKDFVGYYEVQAIKDGQWYILSDIPYQKGIPQLYAITEHPLHADMWKILTDIPYQPEFPQYIALQPLNYISWYILSDIPYQKEFAPLYDISQTPAHLNKWYILTDIPYQPKFAEYNALQQLTDLWYILDDIPYEKEFPQLYAIDNTPTHLGQWYIKTDIPYQRPFVPWYELQPLLEQWYILNDIPYKKEFPQLHDIDAVPKHPGQWYILTDIPYQLPFPMWYELQAISELWYILYDIPYKKEFPVRYNIDARPKHKGWYILYDIPYQKDFPRLYRVEPIPERRLKYYYTIGTAAIGRWQVRKVLMHGTIPPSDEWTLIEDLGPPSAVLSACIEADGDFDYIAGNDSITLTTTDTPWMAVITTTKKLYVKQVCADITTAILLDTGVEQASLCRGWKSDKYSVDSGLICAYRKSNGVFAKVYKKVNDEYVWETLPQLLYEPVDHVEVKRLNDYRIGVYVTNPNRLLLSERFYIGGTSKTEYVHLKSHSWVNVATAHTVDEPANQDFTFLSATIENERFIRVHGKYPIYSIDRDVTNIILTDSYNYSNMVDYAISGGDILVEMDKPKLNAWNTISVTFATYNHIKYVAGDSRTGVVPGQTITVLNDFVPKEYINLTMGSVVSELKTTEMQHYKINMPKEMISMSMSSTVSELIATEVQRKQYNAKTETIILSMNSVVSELQTTQVGDLPV